MVVGYVQNGPYHPYYPHTVGEVEYENAATLMEKLISKQEEILDGMRKLKKLLGGEI